MRTKTSFEAAPAPVGLAALAVYVLACTSFSPDDSQVLYPTYDPKAGGFGVGLYDRKTGRATTLFLPQQPSPDDTQASPALLRPHWFADGHCLLVAGAREAGHDALGLTVLPQGQPGTPRFMPLEGIPEAGSQLARPLAVASTCFAAGDNQMASEDCALFLLDLTDPQRNVTRVPVPQPPGDLDGCSRNSHGTAPRPVPPRLRPTAGPDVAARRRAAARLPPVHGFVHWCRAGALR